MQRCDDIQNMSKALLDGQYLYSAVVGKNPDGSFIVGVKSVLHIDFNNVNEGCCNMYFYAPDTGNIMMPYMLLENATTRTFLRNVKQLHDEFDMQFCGGQIFQIVPASEKRPMYYQKYD